MKYLVVKNYIYGTYQTDVIEKKDLLEVKDRMTEMVINLDNMTYFNLEKNEWTKIETKQLKP